MTPAETGRQAEAMAAEILRAKGYRLLARNYSAKTGELDLVMRDGGCIVFVEVRARRAGAMVAPVETVDVRKRNKLIRTAYDYLMRNPSTLQPRFDLFLVKTSGDDPRRWVWEHLPNAFDAG